MLGPAVLRHGGQRKTYRAGPLAPPPQSRQGSGPMTSRRARAFRRFDALRPSTMNDAIQQNV